MINSPDSLAKPTMTNNNAPAPRLHLSMKLSLQRSRCVRYNDFHKLALSLASAPRPFGIIHLVRSLRLTVRPRTSALSVMVNTHRANRLAALRARRTVSSKDNRAGYVDLHKHPACVCFINGSYSKSRARPARRGWGRLGLENRAIAAQTGLLPVTYANDYRRLAAVGRGLVASVLTWLELV